MGKSKQIKRKHILSTPSWSKLLSVGRNLVGAQGRHPFRIATNKIAKLRQSRRTLNKTSNNFAKGVVMNEGTGGQYTSFTVTKKCYLNESVLQTLAPYKSVFNRSLQLLSAIGKQNVAVPLLLYNQIDTALLYADISGASTQNRIFLKKAQAHVMMSNIYLSNVTIDIYDCIARRDLSTAVCSTPLTAWTQGDTDEGVASEFTKIGGTPYQTELFNQYWRVAKTTRVVLGSGQMHKHHVNIEAFKNMTYSVIQNASYGFQDLTYACLVVISGAPANDTVTQTQVTVGAGGLNMTTGVEYTSTVMFNLAATVKDHSQLLTAFTTAEQVVNTGGTTVTTNIEG